MPLSPKPNSSPLVSQPLRSDHPLAGRPPTTRKHKALCRSSIGPGALAAIFEKDGFHHDFRELLCAKFRDHRGAALIPHATDDSPLCRAHQICIDRSARNSAYEHRS